MTGVLAVTFALGLSMVVGAGVGAVDGWSLQATSGGFASVPLAISPNLKRVDLTPTVEAATRKGGWVIDARIEQAWDMAIADSDGGDKQIAPPPVKMAPRRPTVAAKWQPTRSDAAVQPGTTDADRESAALLGTEAMAAMASLKVAPRVTGAVDLGLGVHMGSPSDSKPARHEPFGGWGDYDATGAQGAGRDRQRYDAVELPLYSAKSCLPAYPATGFDAMALLSAL